METVGLLSPCSLLSLDAVWAPRIANYGLEMKVKSPEIVST